jgi:hypothetical protein
MNGVTKKVVRKILCFRSVECSIWIAGGLLEDSSVACKSFRETSVQINC